jgi:hypothetical protein
MDWACCGTTFHLRIPHRETGKAPGKEIVLWLEQGCPARIPLEMMVSRDEPHVVHAKLCDLGSTQCDDAASAKIRLEFVSKNGKHASGNFTADFPNARHEEGKFKVKMMDHRGPVSACE